MTRATFEQCLGLSEPAVYAFSDWLRRRGWTIILDPIRVRPHVSARRAYSDSGDIHARKEETSITIDVKYRAASEWTSAADFPYDEILLGNAKRFREADPKPDAYALVSKSLRSGIIVNTNTSPRWVEKTLGADLSGDVKPVLMAPLDCAAFIALN